MNNTNWEQQLIKRMSVLPKYQYTKEDRIQDAWMLIGGLLILGFWIFQVANVMKGLAGI
ncbi:MAG: hypothetical protein ACREHC_08945 [Candidatus Levyibacteriota bacterium]